MPSRSMAGNSGRNVQGILEERKSVPSNGQIYKAGSYKSSSASKPKVMSKDSKKQLGVINGMGPDRSVGIRTGTAPIRAAGPKSVPLKVPNAKMEKKNSAAAARNLPFSVHKTPPSKMHSSDSRQQFELKKGSQECSKDNKLVKQVSSRSDTMSNVQRPKKKQISEDEEALEIIRKMFQ